MLDAISQFGQKFTSEIILIC